MLNIVKSITFYETLVIFVQRFFSSLSTTSLSLYNCRHSVAEPLLPFFVRVFSGCIDGKQVVDRSNTGKVQSESPFRNWCAANVPHICAIAQVPILVVRAMPAYIVLEFAAEEPGVPVFSSAWRLKPLYAIFFWPILTCMCDCKRCTAKKVERGVVDTVPNACGVLGYFVKD